jgi:microcystin-dependent protein
MARNGSGTYSIPVTMTAGTSATAADQNTNFSDIATALTQSLAVDGQTPMTGQLPAAVGSLAAPGYTFNGDLDTGRYHSGADGMVDVCGGTALVTYSTTAIAFNVPVSGVGAMPVGAVMPFAGATAPSGWLLCYGQAVSRTTYAALFTATGTAHGVGDGSTTFNVPDMRGRAPIGLDNIGGSSAERLSTYVGHTTLGTGIGAEQITLSIAQIPSHNHGGSTSTDGDHAHSYQAPVYNTNASAGSDRTVANSNTSVNTGTAGAHSHTITSQGGGGAHNNVQPSLTLNYILYAGV